ncbi:ABC transporter permease subunit [Streptomyces regalis]|uniref:ABC transporter permease n=1 Tax=Streptomyces regalis TaxID=68262 RepID=A0A0X3VA62_9ACTN|nr:ABC transporter permease subunit [Streptomyces regalis]KUL41681.1 hypothetical protein ADL12_11225 [Streptomyces regalis]
MADAVMAQAGPEVRTETRPWAGQLRAAMAFEWVKLRTLRSTWWSLAVYAVLTVTVALLTGYALRGSYADMDAARRAEFDALAYGFSGLQLGMMALVVFGVLAVSGEFTSGTIRGSFAAVPRRGVFYAAKLLTGALTAGAVSVPVVAAGFAATQALLGGPGRVALTDDGVARALIGAVLYTTLLSVFAMGLATVLRSPAVTLSILLPLFSMLSTILSNLPGVRTAAQFLPDVAGGLVLLREPPDSTVLDAWTGMAVLMAWTAASVTAGYLALRRRDA